MRCEQACEHPVPSLGMPRGAKGALTRTPTPQHRGTEPDGWISRVDVDVGQDAVVRGQLQC